MQSDALISPCGLYRYWLTRRWDMHKPEVCFIMLNPSTADAAVDDPTIRRCVGYARAWGYGRLVVVNLFALRATNPMDLRIYADPIGPENDNHILAAAKSAGRVVCAWGTHGTLHSRGYTVQNVLLKKESIMPYALKLSKQGHPCHPLYLKGDLQPVPML